MAYTSYPQRMSRLFAPANARRLPASAIAPAYVLTKEWLDAQLGVSITGIWFFGTLTPDGQTITGASSLTSLQGNHTATAIGTITYGTNYATWDGSGGTIPGIFASSEPAPLTIISGGMAPNPNDYCNFVHTTSSSDSLGMGNGWNPTTGYNTRAQPNSGFQPRVPMKKAIAPGDFANVVNRRSSSQFAGKLSVGPETLQSITPALRPTTALRIGSNGYIVGSYVNKPTTICHTLVHLGTLSEAQADIACDWLTLCESARGLLAL